MSRRLKNDTAEHIGARMRQEREARGYSRQEGATAIGVRQQQIFKYEDGSNRVSAPTLARFARWLGVHPGIFFD